ncbi:MAG TPA: protease inhibitor I42 family protein [Acidimicrobiia bacterium]
MTRRKWIALVVLVAIGIGLLVAVVAIPWGDDAPAVQAPTVYHQGDDISVREGDEFVVALPANPSTGYSWTAADNPDVMFVSSHQAQGGSQPGAPGTQELSFRADHAGQSTLELAYSRSFEPGVPPAKTAKFPVTVKAAK